MIFTHDEMPTPTDVLPLVECAVPALTASLRGGIKYADEQQPDPETRDPWYWSHSARWKARGQLLDVSKAEDWTINPKVPNSGIHLCVSSVHTIRVLRSLKGTAPHPGRNKARRRDWIQSIQRTLSPNDGGLPSLSLLIDWQEQDGEPIIYVSLPKRPWRYGSPPALYWRVPVSGDVDKDLDNLSFDPGLFPDDVMVTFKVDPAEKEAG